MGISRRLAFLAFVAPLALSACSFDGSGFAGVSADGSVLDLPSGQDVGPDLGVDGAQPNDSATDAQADGDLPRDQAADRGDLLGPTDDGTTDVLPADVLPADVLPADVLPADVLPADVLPADVLPADVLPADVLPADVLPPDVLAPDLGFPCGSCPLGCDSAKTRCAELVPSGFTTAELLKLQQGIKGSCDLSPTNGQSYKVATGGSTPAFPGCPNAFVYTKSQGTGLPSLTVFAFETLRIGANAQLDVSGTRGLVLYARKTIVVDGVIDAHGRGKSPGPGGRTGGNGYANGSCWFSGGQGRRGSGGNPNDSGGGGGAFGSTGADGGDAGGRIGGVGGSIAQAPSSIIPLIGGCSGGGGASDSDAGAGGGGGGAVHLVAGESVAINGTVNGGGGGGSGGRSGESGGGGGSGGALLLESQQVTVSGTIATNGGGGGSGDGSNTSSNGLPGEDGLASAVRAKGGASTHQDSGAGGRGAASNGPATSGSNNENAGGGGGGVGRIHVRAPSGSVSGTASPTQTSDTSIVID